MTNKEICNILKTEFINNGYQYGFMVDNKKYSPRIGEGFDEQYFNLSITIYRIQEPLFTMQNKIGTCIDTCLVMQYMLNKFNIPNKIWLLYSKEKNKVHTILTFYNEDKVIYLELTPNSTKSCYGNEIIYNDEQELFDYYKGRNIEVYDVTDKLEIGALPKPLFEKIVNEQSNITKY